MRGRRGRPPREARVLDLPAIAAAGLAEAAEDADGFSLRRLARRLGVTPMTLLHHAGSLDGLLRAMVAQAFAPPSLPPGAGPARRVVARLSAYAQAGLAHPALVRLTFARPGLLSEGALHHLNSAVLADLQELGLDERMARRCRDAMVDLLHGRLLALAVAPAAYDEDETAETLNRLLRAFAAPA